MQRGQVYTNYNTQWGEMFFKAAYSEVPNKDRMKQKADWRALDSPKK